MFTYQADRNRNRSPLQQVIINDLCNVAAHFSSQLAESNLTRLGESFQLFLNLYERENIALVQTMGLPPRCDPECFSQLLSASCLTFLHQNWTDLPFAAFGIFSLYAFFQSSPLPVVQPSPPWQLFPMGLVHPDNPKLGYRRRFRQRIRIHRREYASIQRWRHVFLGYHNASSFNVHGAHYSWLNVLAGDVLEVLNRLEFEWSEYSGPRGVDALAAGMLDGWFKLDIPLEESMEEIVTNVGSSEERDLTRTTTDALKHYHAKLQAIELSSTSQHAKRVQVALKALAGKDYWQDQMNKLAGDSTHDLGLQEERGTVVVVPASEDHEFVSPACDAALPALCNIRLPPTVSESMQYHIRSAIQHLLQRGEKFLLPRPQARDDAEVIQPISIAQTRLQEKLSRHDNFLMVQDDLQPQFDSDMSDVSDEEIHYALDDVGENNDSDDNGESAPGLGALKVLLSQARPSAKNSRRKRRTSLPEDTMSVAQSSVGRKALMSLLQQATKGGQVVQDIDSEAESLPSLKSKRNEASLTEYSAGRQALTSLLRQASERAHTSRSTRRHRAIKAHDIAGRKPQPKRTQAHSDEESDGSSSLGRNAMTTPPESVLDSQEPSIAASSVGHLALSSLLKQVNHEFDAKGMSASIRKLPTRGRRIQNERRTMPDGRRKKSDNDASTFGLPLGDSYNMPTGCIPGDEASSVAASSIGHLALSTLLKQVNDQSTTKRRSTTQRKLTVRSGRRLQGEGSKKLTRKLKMSGNEASAVGELLDIPTGPTREDEVSSVAASSIGHQALSSLLKQANNERNTNEMPTLRRRLPVRGGRSVSDDGNARPVRKRKKSGTEASTGGILLDDSYNMPTGCIPGDEASSVAASSIGHQALSSLLKQVKDHSTTKRKSTTQRKTSDRRGQAAPEEGNKKLSAKRKKAVNETSFAGRIQKDLSISRKGAVSGDKASSLADSSTGHQALPSLLKHADDESTAKQVSASLRQLPDRGGRRVPNKRLTEPTRKKSGNQSSNLRTLSDDSVNSRPGLIAGDEASSVAASSVGHLALSSLLKQVNDESRAKQPSTSPYKTPIRVRQGQQDDRNVNRAEKRRKSENGETSKDSTTTAVVLIDDDSVYSTSSVPRDDECSIAASSVGGQMLSSLLKQVNS